MTPQTEPRKPGDIITLGNGQQARIIGAILTPEFGYLYTVEYIAGDKPGKWDTAVESEIV